MDVAYINPFISATSNLFETMIKVPLRLGKPTLRKPDDRLFKLYQLSAVIDITGTVEGRVVISLTSGVATALAAGLIGKPYEVVNEDVLDAVTEIANMISGGAKKALPDAQGIKLSMPSVISTQEVASPAIQLPVIIIPFDTAAGRFIIETSLRRQPGSEKPPETKAA